ncbi:hypothetical protein [Clostridium sp. DMHC 10]|nr:hypothetical protein [Clostridium sp. DMHC 10]
MNYRKSEVAVIMEQFKKNPINLGEKIIKYLDISICLSVQRVIEIS